MNPLQFYKCLGDETRLRCLLLIAHEGELCVCELTEALAVSQPKVSRHLAQLRSCGLLRDRRQCQWVFYRLEPALPSWVTSVLNQTLDANRPFISNNLHRLAVMTDRPSHCCDTS